MSMAKERKKPKPPAANPWPRRLLALRDSLGPRFGKKRATQEEAATLIRVTRRAWILWEKGEKIPSPPFAKLISLLETHPESFS